MAPLPEGVVPEDRRCLPGRVPPVFPGEWIGGGLGWAGGTPPAPGLVPGIVLAAGSGGGGGEAGGGFSSGSGFGVRGCSAGEVRDRPRRREDARPESRGTVLLRGPLATARPRYHGTSRNLRVASRDRQGGRSMRQVQLDRSQLVRSGPLAHLGSKYGNDPRSNQTGQPDITRFRAVDELRFTRAHPPKTTMIRIVTIERHRVRPSQPGGPA